MQVAVISDIGRVRSKNEDSYLIDENMGLLAVCDGMGGHNGGEVASAIAVETIKDFMATNSEDFPGRLVLALQEANTAIYRRAQREPALHGMGTTATLAVVDGKRLYIAHIGDSGLYLLHEGVLSKATRDHTLAQQLLAEGRLRKEDMRSNPYNHILTRALGVEADVHIDQYLLQVEKEDILLLCSDGLSDTVSDLELKEILEGSWSDLNEAARELVNKALNYGGSDNITVVLSRI